MKIEIFTTSTCHYCRECKKYLKGRKIKYIEHDVTRDSNAAAEMIEKTGQQGVPVILVNNDWKNAIIGFDEEAIERAINKNS